jgi:four helix bundle protein
MLSFQKLDVYQRAIDFLALALEIISRLPKGHGRLTAQLRESAQSTVSNIAEGAGRRTRADAGHHYLIARGSAMESASHLDVMKVMAIVTSLIQDRVAIETFDHLCDRIASGRCPQLNRIETPIAIRQGQRRSTPSPSPSPSTPNGTPRLRPPPRHGMGLQGQVSPLTGRAHPIEPPQSAIRADSRISPSSGDRSSASASG